MTINLGPIGLGPGQQQWADRPSVLSYHEIESSINFLGAGIPLTDITMQTGLINHATFPMLVTRAMTFVRWQIMFYFTSGGATNLTIQVGKIAANVCGNAPVAYTTVGSVIGATAAPGITCAGGMALTSVPFSVGEKYILRIQTSVLTIDHFGRYIAGFNLK